MIATSAGNSAILDQAHPRAHRDEADRERPEQLQRRGGQERHPQHARRRLAVALAELADRRDRALAPTEQAQGGEPRHRVEEVPGQALARRPLAPRAGLRRPPEQHREHGHQRQGHRDDRRRSGVGQREHHQHRRRQHHRQHERGQRAREPPAQRVHPVTGEPDDLRGVLVGEPVEQALPLALDHPLAGPRRQPRLEPREQRPADDDGRQHGDRPGRDLPRARDQRRHHGRGGERDRHRARRLRDADEHQPRHTGPGAAGEGQQARVDRTAGTGRAPLPCRRAVSGVSPGRAHVATRSLATR
ncbi:MAG TPA: hypothetical protein VK935_14775 [Actinomycetospora sp.]|nr:hypothetical protein [Actinomycetospora sp.]